MSDKTGIEWTDATWNPVTGCAKVSQGCKHCYAERDWARLSAPRPKPNIYTGRNFTDVRCHLERLDQPLQWRRPRRIFVNSMSDLFHDDVPDQFIADVFGIMAAARQHTFQVLTKRPQRMRDLLLAGCMSRFEADAEETAAIYTDEWPLQWPLPNVWLGVSVEDQATADERIPLLLQTPAAVRWISAEPLLGPVDLRFGDPLGEDDDSSVGCYPCWWRDAGRHEHYIGEGCGRGIDWVVAGGESGPKARPMHPAWVRSLRDQCAVAGVRFLFKQWGEYGPAVLDARDDEVEPWRIYPDGKRAWNATESITPRETWPKEIMARVGKKTAGRLLDGKLHDEYPA